MATRVVLVMFYALWRQTLKEHLPPLRLRVCKLQLAKLA